MKRIIVISTSLRHGSNSDMLADKFVEGAKGAGNDVEKISLSDNFEEILRKDLHQFLLSMNEVDGIIR